MHRNNISFSILSNLFGSIISSNCALVFRLGKNLSNIPRFILSKQIILTLTEHKYLISYLFSSDQTSLLAQIFAIQVEYYNNRYMHKALSFLQFPTIKVSGPDNETICWHRDIPMVQHFNNTPKKS
jgi:hypothetical protein